MRHNYIKLILFTLLATSPFLMKAQVNDEEVVLLNNKKDTLVQVAYRKVAKDDLLGGVSVINYEGLTQKNYNTYSLDNIQGYVGGWNGNSLWAMDDYLVLIDGIPREASNVLPTEIKQITFMKGASAVVLYGSRAAKGVIYITTKRGTEGNLKIDVRANTGYYVPKSYPKYLGSAEYMTLYNEALGNDGLSALYSDEDIYNYASENNPYRYPNVNFYSSDYLRDTYNRTDVVTEISGGNEKARFYSNIGFYYADDLFKFGEGKNNNINRLNIRGNVDLKLNDFIKAYINTNVTFYNSRSANVTDEDDDDGITDTYWTYASKMRPNRVSPLIPLSYIDKNDLVSQDLISGSNNIIDGKYFLAGTQVDQTNVFADYYAAGHTIWTSRQFQFDTGLDFDLKDLLKGLVFHTQFAVDHTTSYSTSYNNSYAVYEPDWYNYNGTDVIGGLTKYNNDEKSGVQNITGSTSNQTIAFSGYFTYENSINKVHNLSAMLVAAGYQLTETTVYHRECNANLGLQLGYNYKGKYYADFGTALVHTAKLAEGHREALSPSLTLGWKLHKESFLANSSVVDELVWSISGSVLNTDLDIEYDDDEYYLYEGTYDQANGAWWGWYDGASEHSTNSIRGANEDLTFIKRKEFSTNVRTSLWNKTLAVNASFFINSMEGLIIEPSTLFPSYFSTYYPDASFVPLVNYNNNRRVGFDFSIYYNNKIGDVDLSLGVSGTYYDTKATRRDETYEYPYQNREGKAIDGIWGLKSDGLFQDQDEIDNSPEQTFGGTIKPGDIKYIDQNNDGIIDSKDVVFLNKGGWYGAPFTLGLNFTAKWNGLTFFALGTGGFGACSMKNSSYYWVYGEGKYSEVVRGRWTEDTKETATFPRLTTESGTNNFRDSDYWMYKTNAFRIAKVQLTYDFPKSVFKNLFVKGVSAYISGSDLLTISKERKVLEMNITSAPQTRFYNIGFKAMF